MKKRLFLLLTTLVFCILVLLYLQRSEIQHLYYHFFAYNNVISQESSSGEEKIRIAFLDIGQGDASFMEWPDGTQMLTDCSVDDRILEALGRVMSPNDRTIDYLAITHPDLDHYGGCVDVMKRFRIKHILYNGYTKNTSKYFPVFLSTIHDLEKTGTEYHVMDHEQTWTIGSSTLHFLYPDMPIDTHPVLKASKKKDPSNETSLLYVLQYGKEKVMFTGDAEFDEENYILKKYTSTTLDVDVLKVGHHGSAGSTSDAFLKVLTPEYATISVGDKNRYGHPTLRTLSRLERAHAQVWRTDKNGDILVDIYPDHLYVENQ